MRTKPAIPVVHRYHNTLTTTASKLHRSQGGFIRGLVTALTLTLCCPTLHSQHQTTPSPTRTESAIQSNTTLEAYALLKAGETAQAMEAFERALKTDSEDLSALLGQAMIFAERQEHQQAFSTYDRVVQLAPSHTFAWNRRGLAAFNLEDFDAALISFERATATRPVNGFFYESLAWTHMCRGDYQQAATAAKTATLMYNREGESTIYPLLIAYYAYATLGDIDNARRSLAYAERNRPQDWPAPVIDFIAGRINQSALISFVTNHSQETEARTYIGLQLSAQNEPARGAPHLEWVSRQGDPKVFEYTLARALQLQSSVATLETTSSTTATTAHP